MKEMIGVCTVAACSTMFLSYHLMKQRDEIRELTNKYEEEKLNNKENLKEEQEELNNKENLKEEEELKKKKKPVIFYHGLLSGSNFKFQQMCSELQDEIEVLSNACLQNPHDTQLLRRCALGLIEIVHLYGETLRYGEAPKMLKEAKSKLKKVLEADQDDHEAIFKLGLAHFYLPKFDITLGVEKHIISWKKALQCFNKVEVPEPYKSSNMLEHLHDFLREKAPAVELSEMGEMDDDSDDEMDNGYLDLIERHDVYRRDCEAADIRNTLNPNAFHNSRNWSTLSYTTAADIRNTLNPNAFHNSRNWSTLSYTTGDMDNEALLDAYMDLEVAKDHMYDLHGEKAEDFSAECPLRNAELSALSKASPMVLNEMGHVAVLSEERSRRNAQFQTSLFNLGSPKEIDSQHQNYNPRRFLSVECPMRIGAQKLGIPAVAIQIRGMRGTRSYGSAAPILRLLLQQLISRK